MTHASPRHARNRRPQPRRTGRATRPNARRRDSAKRPSQRCKEPRQMRPRARVEIKLAWIWKNLRIYIYTEFTPVFGSILSVSKATRAAGDTRCYATVPAVGSLLGLSVGPPCLNPHRSCICGQILRYWCVLVLAGCLFNWELGTQIQPPSYEAAASSPGRLGPMRAGDVCGATPDP